MYSEIPKREEISEEVSIDEDNFQLTSELVDELQGDFYMDVSDFLQLQKLLLSDEFMCETAMHGEYKLKLKYFTFSNDAHLYQNYNYNHS